MHRQDDDRHYVGTLGALQTIMTKLSRSHADSTMIPAGRETFRAGLLYVAADLRQLAAHAPASRREQVCAISELLAAIARS
jgi:hypothetical protein